MKTGNGKIANLPAKIRDELNWRINDGEEGRELIEWLNAKPEVVDVVTRLFDGKPISQQNLSQWRTRGYRQWHVHRIIVQEMMGLASNSEDFEETGVDCEKLVVALTANYAEMIQRWIITPPELMTYRREVFKDLTHEVLALRHSGFRKQQLAIQQKRLELSERKANAGGGPGNRRPASRSRASTSPPPSVSQSLEPESVETVEASRSPEPAESPDPAASREPVESIEAAASRELVESIEAVESSESAPESRNPDHAPSSLTVLSLPNGSNAPAEVVEAMEEAESTTLAEEAVEVNREAGVLGRVEEAVEVNREAGVLGRAEEAVEMNRKAGVPAPEAPKEPDALGQTEEGQDVESDGCPSPKEAAAAGLSEAGSVSAELARQVARCDFGQAPASQNGGVP